MRAVLVVRWCLARGRVLQFNEFEQACIDPIGMRGRHAVRQSSVGLQCTVLQELYRLCPGKLERANLVVLIVHHQDQNDDRATWS